MKTIIIYFLIASTLAMSACTWRSSSTSAGGMTAYDGVSSAHKGDAQALAESTAQALALRYPPGHTSLALVTAPGEFGHYLETALRHKGFSVAPGDQSASVRVAYVLDEIQGEPSCYLQVKTSDGGSFGLVRELTNDPGVLVTEPPLLPSVATALAGTLPEKFLQDVPPATFNEQAHEPTPELGEPSYPVRSKGTAKQIAVRNGVSVADFCRWNGITPDKTLSVGRRVYLHEPAAGTTVVQAAVSPPSLFPSSSVLPAASTHAVAMPTQPLQPMVTQPVPKEVANPSVTSSKSEDVAILPMPSEPAPVPSSEKIEAASAMDVVTGEATPQTWNIAPGALRTQLSLWASQGGYQLIWKANHDYEMEAHANFRGEFLEAVKQLFSGLQRVGYPLRVTVYKANNVLEVREN